MKTKTTLILTHQDIVRLSHLKSALTVVKEAFGQYAHGKTQMPPKVYLDLPQYHGDFRAMPAFFEDRRGRGACAIKWVNVHPNNRRIGLPTVMGTLILSDPKTGFPLAVMDGTEITSIRTAAAGGVAAKYLARKDSKIVALVGCGVQAKSQWEALRLLFNIREGRVWGKELAEAKKFVKQNKVPKIQMIPVKRVEDCVRGADIVVTTTPSRRPLVKGEWLKAGVHINAIGADAPGKQELDPRILQKAKVVIDDWKQASHSGEINVALKKGLISQRHIYSMIGDIVVGKKKGRTHPDEITVFDSTGLAIQDLAVAQLIYQFAIKKRIGKCVQLI